MNDTPYLGPKLYCIDPRCLCNCKDPKQGEQAVDNGFANWKLCQLQFGVSSDVINTKSQCEIWNAAVAATEARMKAVWEDHLIQCAKDRGSRTSALMEIQQELSSTKTALEAAIKSKDSAYSERNKLVCTLSKLFPASLERHEGGEWEDDWRWIVFIYSPVGQLSWHIHDGELEEFSHLERNKGIKWDGHTTDEKYLRLKSISYFNALQVERKKVEELRKYLIEIKEYAERFDDDFIPDFVTEALSHCEPTSQQGKEGGVRIIIYENI